MPIFDNIELQYFYILIKGAYCLKRCICMHNVFTVATSANTTQATHTCNAVPCALIVTHLVFFTEFPTVLTTCPFKTFWRGGGGKKGLVNFTLSYIIVE